MKLLFDFFPVVLFFIAYKVSGIYFATAVAIGASLIQVFSYWIKHRQIEKMHLITLILMLLLGGATLLFHDPTFIKWKPTGIYWASAVIFFASRFIGSKPLIQKMMEKNIDLPYAVWSRLNLAWVFFFSSMGAINLYVAYYYSTDTWVNFKLFGGMGITLLFVLLQALYLSKHIVEDKVTEVSPEQKR